MDDWKKFDINVKKLKLENFRNHLTSDFITVKYFEFFKSVCKWLNIKTLSEYHDLYLINDMLILANVFESFRKVCKEYYGLDCANYLSAAGLSWNSLLKMMGIKLELLTDFDQRLFIEKELCLHVLNRPEFIVVKNGIF